jgi:hypothetical protein
LNEPILLSNIEIRLDLVDDGPLTLVELGDTASTRRDVNNEPFLVLLRSNGIQPFSNLRSKRRSVNLVVLWGESTVSFIQE